MAANMPDWITRTLGFLGHPRGPQTISALAPSGQLEQASSAYSKALPPLPRKAHLERQRVRATKRSRRSHTRSPTWNNDRLEERSWPAPQEPFATVDYEDSATQTLEPHDARSIERIKTMDHPAVMEDAPTAYNTGLPQARNQSYVFPANEQPYSQLRDQTKPESNYTRRESVQSSLDCGTASETQVQSKETNEHHAYKVSIETSSEMPGKYPARSCREESSITSFDNKAAVEAMEVDSQSMHDPRVFCEAQDQVVTDNNILNGPPYTEGAAQIVRASDGSKDCLALLLTSEMVTKISQIATRSRRLEFIRNDLRKMKREVESGKNMIDYKTDAIQDTNDQATIAQINKEIDDTRKRLAAAVKCVEAIEDEIMTLTDNLAFSREQCQEMFEDVLSREDLLEVADAETAQEVGPTISLGSNYSEEHSLSREGPQTVQDPSVDETISIQLEDVVRRTAKEDFEEKRNIFYTLDEAFEHRQENLAEEKAEYLRRVEEGTCDLSQTDFDLLALEDFQRLTANLRHAEEEFEEAFKRAKQLGVLDEHDAYYQQSVFSEWSGGYPMSMEHAMVDCAPTKRIDYWQTRVDDSQGTGLEPWGDPDLEPENRALEDCEIKSVAISDSWSCVDWTRNRRRIDRWREIAGRDR